ncbi:hypothetical protein CDV36_008793 [Fusarium kuroshium]|uniref:Zn(2)-C6 fungal-type domain-containing protein n=1 Tax=Fusarium kuroshium TaxID=2010991 RepID=A0A3M2S224_9HYPO|nr:hypothetical protein CDV36_008793 [Fusarium kuroshium]
MNLNAILLSRENTSSNIDLVHDTDILSSRPRLLQSCAECRRRKIKCDKRVPCRACKERGEGALCQRAPAQQRRRRPEPATQSTSEIDGLKAELAWVRRRLDAVEAELGIDGDDDQGQQENDDHSSFQESGLVGAMEDAAFDIGQVHRWKDNWLATRPGTRQHETKWFDAMPLEACMATLPSRRHCESLVEAFLTHLNWFCGCLHGPALRTMHREFWAEREKGETRDTMFLSLLFAILSVTGYLLDDQQASEAGLQSNSLCGLAPVWFDCSYASFFRCNGLSEPSLVAVQAMITLTYPFHLSGNSKTHRSMFGINIGLARATGLHLLGSHRAGPFENAILRETGCRAWWYLVETEWSFLPYHRYSYVVPHDFDTTMPDMTDEGLVASSKSNSVNSLLYLLASCYSSRVLYDLYGTLRLNQHPSYEAVLAANEQLDRIRTLFSTFEAYTNPLSSHVYMRRLTGMTLAYRCYLVHRPYFVKSLSDPSLSRTRDACILAARTILDLSDEGLPKPFYHLWNVTIWLIAAGLILALDLVKAANSRRVSTDADERRSKLDSLADLLGAHADRSGIGVRGARLIRNLRAMEGDIIAGRRISLASMTHKEIMALVSREPADPSTRDCMAWSPGANNDVGEVNYGTNDVGDLAQPSFDPLRTMTTERDQFLDFFADLGQ